jgi:galactokinase
VRVFRAPGRVNLIGEHTDYNDGFVLPAAIEFAAFAAAGVRQDNKLLVRSENFAETREFDLAALPRVSRRHWSDYVAGVAIAAREAGLRLPGANLMIRGEVPIGAGLSSSAALEMVTAFALFSLAGAAIDRTAMALLCQQAEREFAGVQVGIMDQFVSAHARAGCALLLDCRSLDFRFACLPAGVRLVACDTHLHHELAGSAYNQRREECERGVAILARFLPGIGALRDVQIADLERHCGELPPLVYRRCRHVVSENQRVLNASTALEAGDLRSFGSLMYDSHRSLRDDYEVSCPELDIMAGIASRLPGVYGARMTGGGFGGSTINLVAAESVEKFGTAIAERYHAATGIAAGIYVTDAAEGAGEVTLSSAVSD